MKYQPDAETLARIERDFTYRSPNPDQVPRYGVIRDTAKQFAGLLVLTCPKSRELSLALTALEQVVMNANAAIDRGE